MKLSLRWIADHLGIDWKTIDKESLVKNFNTKVAEIESIEDYKLEVSSFFLAQVITASIENTVVECPEIKTEWTLSARTDIQVGYWYLVKHDTTGTRWVTYADFHSDKEGCPRAFACIEQERLSGDWRKRIETEDCILEIDNKTITHRPDLWSHRGVAREIGFLLGVSLKNQAEFITELPVIIEKKAYKKTKEFPFSLSLETEHCKRYAALYIDGITQQPSSLFMAARLMRLNNSAYNFFIDVTNYVCLEFGQPMHAFDAATIETKQIVVRTAKKDEKLQLLKGIVIDLLSPDVVITDGKEPLVLAGIKGGLSSGVNSKTTTLLVEAGTWEASSVRISSATHGIRTESSIRYEKSIDPELTLVALQRFVKLMHEAGIAPTFISPMVVLGQKQEKKVVTVSHTMIEKRLGMPVDVQQILNLLNALEFSVSHITDGDTPGYQITVPTFRATKDIALAEDIVEEVGRLIGYHQIQEQLPMFKKEPSTTISHFERVQKIKDFFAFAGRMKEVQNQAFFNHTFISKIGFSVIDSVAIANPIAEQRHTLVTSLIPHLLENIMENEANHEQLRFFEWGRTWTGHQETIQETRKIAGLWYQKKGEVDFYAVKQLLTDFADAYALPLTWHKPLVKTEWSSAHQVAELRYDDVVIGYMGRVGALHMNAIGGDACAFELNGDFLLEYQALVKRFEPLSKYQATALDVSVLVPLSVTVAHIQTVVKLADPRIYTVQLQDIFTKSEWDNQKSITVRYGVKDDAKTLTKQDIDVVQKAVQDAVIDACQAIIR